MAITYGLDLTTATSFAYGTNYSGYFESALYTVGTNLTPRTFSEIEFVLAKELATGEGIQIKYRVNLTDTWTTIGTYTFTSLGAITSYHEPSAIPPCDMVQIRIELLGTSTTTPQFKYLILR